MVFANDNTSAHSSLRCMKLKAASIEDVYGLLQLATQVIFADEIWISGHEDISIRNLTAEFIEQYGNPNPSDLLLHQESIDPTEYLGICSAAGNEFLGSLQIPEWDEIVLSAINPELHIGAIEQMERFHNCLIKEETRDDLAELAHAAREDSVGGPAYALWSIPDLMNKTRSLVQSRNQWTISDTWMLDATLRIFINYELGVSKDSQYIPAIGRAKIIRRKATELTEKFSRIADHRAGTEDSEEDTIPILWDVLLKRGHLEPNGVLEQAYIIREKTTELRDSFNVYVSDRMDLGESHERAAKRRVAELGRALRQDLGGEQAPSLVEAFEWQGLLPVPSIAKSLEWSKYQLDRRMVAVLTDLSRESQEAWPNPQAMEQFYRNCSRNV